MDQPHSPSKQRSDSRTRLRGIRRMSTERDRRRHPLRPSKRSRNEIVPEAWIRELTSWDDYGEALSQALAGNATLISPPIATSPADGAYGGLAVECLDWTTNSANTFTKLKTRQELGAYVAPDTPWSDADGLHPDWLHWLGCSRCQPTARDAYQDVYSAIDGQQRPRPECS